MDIVNTIFALLVIFQFKHFLCDYPLQNSYMLKKFLPGKEFVFPLMAHSGVHALFTLLIVAYFDPKLAIMMALLDFVVHFVTDRIKASLKMLGRYKCLSAKEFVELQNSLYDNQNPHIITDKQKFLAYSNETSPKYVAYKKAMKDNKLFWWSLGWDQKMHHLTHYLVIYLTIVSIYKP